MSIEAIKPANEKNDALAPKYIAAEVEPGISEAWDQTKAWHAKPTDDGRNSYGVVIPPPNVTAALHMGHALNNTLQDVLIRYHRMRGFNTMWMPGTDHAGIATQTVVDKRLQQEGQPALKDYKKLENEGDNGREQFVGKVQAWKDEYEAKITQQLMAMGCSCDWDRQRFTMDPICAKAVREAFFKLFEDGLIYRGKRLVNWDPVTQTALADDEVEMKDVDGFFYYMRYPLVGEPLTNGDTFVTVATTRPETMLGDTAVAINPKDPRADQLRGRKVILPIVGREIPILEDDYVVLPVEYGGDENDAKAQFASGFLKVTPAHDPNDYDIGLRHDLAQINVMAPDGSISITHGWPEEEEPQANETLKPFIGLSREAARKSIVKWFNEQDLLSEKKTYRHSVGHSYRSHVPVEPYLSDQWYVKVTDDRLAGAALHALTQDQRQETDGCSWKEGGSFNTSDSKKWEGGLTFYPPRYAKNFQTWHENIRDWCISRQLWWGHQIPVWHLEATEIPAPLQRQIDQWVRDRQIAVTSSDTHIFICIRQEAAKTLVDAFETAGFTRDPDVLDTWFSSALWPMSTLGWPDGEAGSGLAALETWNPGSVLCTAREIITLWVSRMVMFNLYFLDRLPFKDVFIHAMIQDGEGQKMSKSLGNGVDPLDIIHSHGADAMRFALTKMTTHTQDVRMPVDVVCPFTGETFKPKMVSDGAGHRVAAPIQSSPSDKNKKMVTGYGVASGKAQPTDEMPQARNSSEKFDEGRNFANKLWNAVRFSLTYLSDAVDAGTALPSANSLSVSELSLADRWIVSRAAGTLSEVDTALKNYEFSRYATALYDFAWRDFCDWYIEAIKPAMQQKDNPEAADKSRRVLAGIVDVLLRLLHPMMPYVTERLWQALGSVVPERGLPHFDISANEENDLLMLNQWPHAGIDAINETSEAIFEQMQQLIRMIRETKKSSGLRDRERVDVSIKCDEKQLALIQPHLSLLMTLTTTNVLEIGTDTTKPKHAAVTVHHQLEVYLHIEIDINAERDRLSKRKAELDKAVSQLNGRLSNKGYVERAPEHLVQQTRDQLMELESEYKVIESQLKELE